MRLPWIITVGCVAMHDLFSLISLNVWRTVFHSRENIWVSSLAGVFITLDKFFVTCLKVAFLNDDIIIKERSYNTSEKLKVIRNHEIRREIKTTTQSADRSFNLLASFELCSCQFRVSQKFSPSQLCYVNLASICFNFFLVSYNQSMLNWCVSKFYTISNQLNCTVKVEFLKIHILSH